MGSSEDQHHTVVKVGNLVLNDGVWVSYTQIHRGKSSPQSFLRHYSLPPLVISLYCLFESVVSTVQVIHIN